MSKWKILSGPITAAIAEAEPETQRLFNQPKRPMSRELAALFAQVERERDQWQAAAP